MRFQFSGPAQKRGFDCACLLCLPRPQRFRQPEAWRPLSGRGAPFPSAAPAHVAGRSQEVSRQEPEPVCRVGGGGFSGTEFAPFPYPLPPTSSGDGPALLCSFSVPLFWLIFLSLSHSLKNLPPTALRAFWPVLTLSNAAHSSPFRPHLLVAGAGVWGTFLLGVAFRHVICGPYLISPPS